MPWRRPGFQLGLDIAAVQRQHPEAVGVILGGHGITAWGDTSDECERNSLWIIDTAADYIATHGKPEPFGPVLDGLRAVARSQNAEQRLPRWRRRSGASPRTTSRWSATSPTIPPCSTSCRAPHTRGWRRSARAAPTTSCGRRSSRCCSTCRPRRRSTSASLACRSSIERYRDEYRAYYETYAEPDSPAMRGADPLIVLVPGVGMFSFGRNKQTARVAGEFYLNAINVMRGAEALSTYQPISDREKFRIEYWSLEEAKLQRMPKPKSHATRVAFVTGAASGIGKAIAQRLAADGACVVVADLDEDGRQVGRRRARRLRRRDRRRRRRLECRRRSRQPFDEAMLAFGGVDLIVNNAGLSLSKPLLETSEADWDLQHDVMAKGSFLVSKAAAQVMIEQGMGGDIVYIASKNSVFAGPNNIAYSATKADQAHQVRLLAVELGEHGIRVNGVNPDGVVRGSGNLRRRVGRATGQDLRRSRGGARRVLRPAHDPQA